MSEAVSLLFRHAECLELALAWDVRASGFVLTLVSLVLEPALFVATFVRPDHPLSYFVRMLSIFKFTGRFGRVLSERSRGLLRYLVAAISIYIFISEYTHIPGRLLEVAYTWLFLFWAWLYVPSLPDRPEPADVHDLLIHTPPHLRNSLALWMRGFCVGAFYDERHAPRLTCPDVFRKVYPKSVIDTLPFSSNAPKLTFTAWLAEYGSEGEDQLTIRKAIVAPCLLNVSQMLRWQPRHENFIWRACARAWKFQVLRHASAVPSCVSISRATAALGTVAGPKYTRKFWHLFSLYCHIRDKQPILSIIYNNGDMGSRETTQLAATLFDDLVTIVARATMVQLSPDTLRSCVRDVYARTFDDKSVAAALKARVVASDVNLWEKQLDELRRECVEVSRQSGSWTHGSEAV